MTALGALTAALCTAAGASTTTGILILTTALLLGAGLTIWDRRTGQRSRAQLTYRPTGEVPSWPGWVTHTPGPQLLCETRDEARTWLYRELTPEQAEIAETLAAESTLPLHQIREAARTLAATPEEQT